jgi:HAD superfamily hydrolase (TIGR01549 family)
VFDFVNTIAFLNPRREQILHNYALTTNGVSLDVKLMSDAFKKNDNRFPYSSVNITSLEEKKDFYTVYNEALFKELDLKNYQGFFDYYNSTYKNWEPNADLFEVLNTLKSKGITIGIASNFDKGLEKIVSRLEIMDYIEFLVVSQEIGVEKPSLEFYNFLKNSYNLKVEQTMYVGDSYFLDYLPAKEVGFKAILLDENNFYNDHTDKILNLKEILEIIRNAS